jgi:hypothetical protein
MARKKNNRNESADSVDITQAGVPVENADLYMEEVEIDDQANDGQEKQHDVAEKESDLNGADFNDHEELKDADSELESIDVNGDEEFRDAYNDPDVALPTPPVEKDGVPGFNLVKASGISDTSSPTVSQSDLPDHATPSPIVPAKGLPVPPREIFGSPDGPPSPPVTDSDPTITESKSKGFNKRMDYMINEFFVSIFQQKIKEKLGSHVRIYKLNSSGHMLLLSRK